MLDYIDGEELVREKLNTCTLYFTRNTRIKLPLQYKIMQNDEYGNRFDCCIQ